MKHLLFIVAAVIAGACAALADDAARPRTLTTMVWSGSAAGSKAAEAAAQTVRGCDSIVACVAEVTRRMNEVGQGNGGGTADQGSGSASATFVVQIEGQAERRDKDYRLSLAVTDKTLVFTPNTPADKRAAIEAEARGVLRALTAWNRISSPEQTKALDTNGRLDLPVPEPFAQLQLLSKPQASVAFIGKAKTVRPPQLVFKSNKTNTMDYEETITSIPYFTPFWIVANYEEDQDADTKTISLKWPGGTREIQATRVTPRLYKSGLLITVPPDEAAPAISGAGSASAATPQ